jgi:hypothetical protein
VADRLRKDLAIGTFANLVAKDLQKAIRMEAADKNGLVVCVTCGKIQHYKQMHAGHFIPGRRMAMLFVEENVHPQCNHCNTFLSGNVTEYERFIVSNYGVDVLESLRKLRHSQHKYTREELADMRDGYKARIKKQEKRLG